MNLYKIYRDALKNPKYKWLVVIGTVLYIISPIDLIPDFIPILGQIDDLALITILGTELFNGWLGKLGDKKTVDKIIDTDFRVKK